MKTSKKIGRAIAKKFKNLKSTTAPKETATQEPSVSNSKDFLKEPEENIPIIEMATEQQTPVTTETCDNSNITIEDQNTPIADNVEAIEIVAQEPNTPDSPCSAEPCDTAGKGENQPVKTTHQKQAILAGITGIALLICSVELYALKVHVTVAVVVGIIGLMRMSFALFSALKPNTKLEKVEQPVVSFESKRNP